MLVLFMVNMHECSVYESHSYVVLCNMYGVYLFNMLFTKFLLTQILRILMVNKLF